MSFNKLVPSSMVQPLLIQVGVIFLLIHSVNALVPNCSEDKVIDPDTLVILNVFGWLGTALGICLFLAPIPMFIFIVRSKSSERYSAAPFIFMLGNNIVWIMYCSLSQQAIPLACNIIGAIIETTYLIIFSVYLPKTGADRRFFIRFVSFALILSLGTGLLIILVTEAIQNCLELPLLGTNAVIFNIGLYAGPLATVKLVWQSHDLKYLPYPLLIAGGFCSLTWSIYGLFKGDIFILIPNVTGLFLTLCQSALWIFIRLKYRNQIALLPDDDHDSNGVHELTRESHSSKATMKVVEMEEFDVNHMADDTDMAALGSMTKRQTMAIP